MKKPNALERIKLNEELIDGLVKVVNQGATRQILFGAALDILINKGLITKEELSDRANEIFEEIRKPKTEESVGEPVSDPSEEAI